jgi:hypothetical protein
LNQSGNSQWLARFFYSLLNPAPFSDISATMFCGVMLWSAVLRFARSYVSG